MTNTRKIGATISTIILWSMAILYDNHIDSGMITPAATAVAAIVILLVWRRRK